MLKNRRGVDENGPSAFSLKKNEDPDDFE